MPSTSILLCNFTPLLVPGSTTRAIDVAHSSPTGSLIWWLSGRIRSPVRSTTSRRYGPPSRWLGVAHSTIPRSCLVSRAKALAPPHGSRPFIMWSGASTDESRRTDEQLWLADARLSHPGQRPWLRSSEESGAHHSCIFGCRTLFWFGFADPSVSIPTFAVMPLCNNG